MKFNDMDLSERIKKGIKYEETTEVQEKTIPLMKDGKNIVCESHTGSGKTLAFGIPLSERILNGESKGAVILCPTRELAVQVEREISELNRNTGIKTVCVYGGHGIEGEIRKLSTKPQIIVATPGRFLDHMERNNINPENYDTVVLDEADRMLDMGFQKDIQEILEYIKPKNTHLFSATMKYKLVDFIDWYIQDREEVRIPTEIRGDKIKEHTIKVKPIEKWGRTLEVIRKSKGKKVLIFVSTKRYAEVLTERLNRKGFRAASIHGDKTQKRREIALSEFKRGRKQILVATDVAARGLQVDDIEYVINYDAANDEDTHQHRIGRTGRMGKTGHAINFDIVNDEGEGERRQAYPKRNWQKSRYRRRN